MKTAVVGHVEWVTFARVAAMPSPGEIVHSSEAFEAPAGGGSVAAVQMLKLAGDCTFYTALGDDELGHRARSELESMGVRVRAVFRDEPQRRAFTHVDGAGERTITVMGSRLGPRGDDRLPWDDLHGVDAVYFTAGDDDALRLARRAKALVATTREAERISRVAVPLDAAVGSARDPAEVYVATEPPPRLIVETEGSRGGRYVTPDGVARRFPAVALAGPVVCAYGAGDSFAAGLTYGLGRGLAADEALELASRCGAACLQGRGPYAGQLTGAEL